VPKPKWRILHAAVFAYAHEASSFVSLLRRKYAGVDPALEVFAHHRRVRAAGTAVDVDVWVVVARKPWKED
jgi:hypothetical protein